MAAPPILVSACLAGLCTDWCGGAATVPWIREAVARGQAIPVCPEQLGGLPTPRVPAEIDAQSGERVVNAAGRDVTEAFHRGAERALAIARAHGCREAILQARSPACGAGQVYDGTFTGTLRAGDGIAAAALRAGGMKVTSVDSLIG